MAKETRRKDKPADAGSGFDAGLGGILKGLAGLVEKLGEIAESGQEVSDTTEIHGEGKEVKGIYGFTVKVGLGNEKTRVEPFGNIRRDSKTGRSVVQEIREPVVDIFEEDDYTLVIAEMPGVTADDIQIEAKDDLLTIYAERGDKKYRKEILLPGSVSKEKIAVSCNNGITEIKCVK